MKYIFTVLICAALLVAPAPAKAFETPASSKEHVEALKNMGEAFLPIARDFGCGVFSWANFTDPQFRTAQLEYVPAGHDVKKWTRLQTTTVYALGGIDAAQDADVVQGIFHMLMDFYKKNSEVIDLRVFENQAGEPAFFIEYKIGSGDEAEHNAGLFMRTSVKAVAFIQIQARQSDLSRADVSLLLAYLGMADKKADAAVPIKSKLPKRKPAAKE